MHPLTINITSFVSLASTSPLMLVALFNLTVSHLRAEDLQPTESNPEFVFDSNQPKINEAYKKAQRVIKADIHDNKFWAGKQWPQVWTRDSAYSTDLALNLLQPALCQSTLLGLSQNVPNIGECWAQDECGHFGGWPNLTDAIVGATGAWALFQVTNDRDSLKIFYKRTVNSLKRAERDAFHSDTGLFGGCSTFMESNSAYPTKYANTRLPLAQTAALSTSALYYNGYVVAVAIAEKLGEDSAPFRAKAHALKDAINKHFWQEKKGYYGYFLDEHHQLSPAMEGMGEALCIQFGIASPEQARRILRSTPTTAWGFPCLWPQWPDYMNYHTADPDYYHNGMIWPFVQGYWARCAVQMGDLANFEGELDKLVKLSEKNDTFQEFYRPEDGEPDGSPDQLWSASGYLSMILHGLLGMNFEEKGIRFAPMVPKKFAQLSMKRIKYRDSALNIKVIGNGTRIARFKLDGKLSTTFFYDGSLKGSHDIEIQMQ